MVITNSFSLPRDGAIYTASIFARCRDLVGYGVWSGIESIQLDLWISNFVTPEEQYFAAKVLDALIYRSDQQTKALMKQMFHRVIPDLARKHNLNPSLQQIYYTLQEDRLDPQVRIIPVVPPYEPPVKSGTIIARMLKRQLKFNAKWIIHPQEAYNNVHKVNSFIFVDDFLGTGVQFSDFLKQTGLESLMSLRNFIYAPLVGHTDGIQNLRNEYPMLFVDTVELLENSHALFGEKSGSFPDDVNTTAMAKEFYYNLLKDRKIAIATQDRGGFGHYELTYAFEHAVPDNSIPILWWAKSASWEPLFNR